MAKAKKGAVEMPVDIVPANESLAQFSLQASVVAGKLTSNAAVLRTAVERELQNYSVERYLDDPAAAKRDKAFLSRASEQVAAKRLEVTKVWNKPLEDFLCDMKTIEASIKEGYTRLNSIVKEAEQREKDAKLGQIEEYFSGINLTGIPLQKIMDQKWLNKSMSLKKVMAEIDDKIKSIDDDINTLLLVAADEDKDTVLGLYLDTLSLNRAMAEAEKLKSLRAKAKEFAVERSEPAEPARQNPEGHAGSGTVGQDAKDVESDESQAAPEVLSYSLTFCSMKDVEAVVRHCNDNGIGGAGGTLHITGDRKALEELRNFIRMNGISYTKGGTDGNKTGRN